MNYRDVVKKIEKGELNNYIIIYGDEKFLINDIINQIKKRYITDFAEINSIVFSNITDNFDNFLETVKTFPFMSEKKVIVVESSDFLTTSSSIDKLNEEKLIKAINDNFNTSIVIFMLNEKKPDMRKKLVKTINEKGNIFEISRFDEAMLVNYIIECFKKHKKKISNSDALYIADNCGYLDRETETDLYMINNEIDKIAGYDANNVIERKIIDELLVKSLNSNIFNLIDNICEGKKGMALKILRDMQQNGAAEQFILFMIVRQYRMIYNYLVLQKSGLSSNEIISKMKISKFVAGKLNNIAKKLSIQKTELILKQLLDIETRVKTGLIDKEIGLDIICNSI